MPRLLYCAKKIACIFLLMGSSFYVYQQFGRQESTQREESPRQGLYRLPSGKTVREHVVDEDVMVGNPVLGQVAHTVVDTGDDGLLNKDSALQQTEELLAKLTRVKDVTGKQHHQNRDGKIRKADPKIVNRGKNQSSTLSNDKKRDLWSGREGRNDQKSHPLGSADGKNDPGSESNDERNQRSGRHKYEELNTRKVNPGNSSELQQKTGNIENKEQNKSFCDIPFEYGQMCPTLYTDLGGYCKIDMTVPGGFDCPDIRRKGHNELRSTQLALTRVLKIFDLVARKHGIKYWITSGTLLGAARHRGFIPWDEDADIAMTLDDYIKFFKCCKNEFPDGIFFQSSETDPYLRPTNETEYHLLRHEVVGLYRRLWNPRLRDTKSCTKYCLEYGCDWADGLMIDIFIAEDTMNPYHLSRVFPLKEMLFEGFRFPVPGNWEEILVYKYGNYNTELGGDNDRIPEDNSDPFHSCEELKQAQNG